MPKKWLLLLAVFFLTSCVCPLYAEAEAPAEEEVCFSPGGRCTETITAQLAHAQHSVKVQAYSFTSKPIAEALIAALQRGVEVEVIVDPGQLSGKGNKVETLARAGVPVWIDSKHAIAHDKVMIIDGVTVVTGSFNFTNAAEDKNAENVLIIRNKKVAAKYRANWYRHREHSRPYHSTPAGSGKSAGKKKAADKKVKA